MGWGRRPTWSARAQPALPGEARYGGGGARPGQHGHNERRRRWRMSEVRTLVIDGKDVAASANQSLLSAARENGIRIPTLCHLEGLSDIGACRLCMVEIEGSPKLFPACTTAAEEGMKVTTNSERLVDYRSKIF